MSPWIELVFTESKQKWPPYFDSRRDLRYRFMHSEISTYDIPKELGKSEQRKERSFPKRNVFTNCIQYIEVSSLNV